MGFDVVSLVLALLILGFLIAIHELGHMLVAKRAGMRVLRFSVGFGPALWKRTYGETTYQIAAVPFGGFVEIDGMNPMEEQEDPNDPRLYENKSVWARAAVILAGPLTNYVFAFLFAGIVYASLGTAVRASVEDLPHALLIEDVSKGAAADKAGLLVGDRVTHVDGYPLKNLNTYYMLLDAHKEGYRFEPNLEKRKALKEYRVKVLRGGEDREVLHRLFEDRKVTEDLTLKTLPKGDGVLVEKVAGSAQGTELQAGDVIVALGDRPVRDLPDLVKPAVYAKNGFRFAGKDRWTLNLWIARKNSRFVREVKPDVQTGMIGVRFNDPILWQRRGFLSDLKAGLRYPIFVSGQMLKSLGKLVRFDKKTAASAQGPVGIVKEVQNRLKTGVSDSLIIVIMLSVLLGLFNLLPLPALDGGRIAFRVLEIVTRVRVNPEREMRIHAYGLWVLLALILVLTVKDVRGCLGI